MGRKTYESIGKPLTNRRNIVLTKKPKNDIEAYTSIPLALEAVKDENQVFVIGGGDTFAQTIGIVERMFLTLIHRDVEGDTFFPPYEELLSNEFLLNREEHFNDFSFLDYIRKSKIIGVK
jgi:dihydrofolate reductase